MPNLSMTARAKSAYLNRTETTYWVDNKCYGDWKNWTYLCCTIYGTDERKDCEKNAEKGYCISITDKEIEAMKERTKNATAPAC